MRTKPSAAAFDEFLGVKPSLPKSIDTKQFESICSRDLLELRNGDYYLVQDNVEPGRPNAWAKLIGGTALFPRPIHRSEIRRVLRPIHNRYDLCRGAVVTVTRAVADGNGFIPARTKAVVVGSVELLDQVQIRTAHDDYTVPASRLLVTGVWR